MQQIPTEQKGACVFIWNQNKHIEKQEQVSTCLGFSLGREGTEMIVKDTVFPSGVMNMLQNWLL